MIKIRSIILDFGGVISKPQNKNFIDKVYRILKQEPSNFMTVYERYRKNYDSGDYSGEDYWSKILEHYRYPHDKTIIDELIREDTKSWTSLNPEMNQFISNTRKQIHNLSIISNMPEDILDYIQKNFHWLESFDEHIWSCEVGVVKPDQGIYEYCLRNIGIPASECLFVDDSLNNVDGAIRSGLNSIHFRSFSQFAEELDEKYRLSDG